MSCTAPRLLRVFVCACAIGGVVELLAESPHPDLRRSSHATDSSILEHLPIDFILNTGQWQAPARFHNFIVGNDRSKWQFHAPGDRSVAYRGMDDGIDVSVREGADRPRRDLVRCVLERREQGEKLPIYPNRQRVGYRKCAVRL